jgi:hypothetical protein
VLCQLNFPKTQDENNKGQQKIENEKTPEKDGKRLVLSENFK